MLWCGLRRFRTLRLGWNPQGLKPPSLKEFMERLKPLPFKAVERSAS